jgi:cell division protease FtsH
LGYVLQRPEDDRYMHTKSELESRIKVALGGTLAEELIYGEIANGATSDLDHASGIARRMVKEYGMSRLGRVFYREPNDAMFMPGVLMPEGPRSFSEETAREIDMEVRSILDQATAEVRAILLARRLALEALAKKLVEKEVIDGAEVRATLEMNYPGPKIVPGSDAIAPREERPPENTDNREAAAP